MFNPHIRTVRYAVRFQSTHFQSTQFSVKTVFSKHSFQSIQYPVNSVSSQTHAQSTQFSVNTSLTACAAAHSSFRTSECPVTLLEKPVVMQRTHSSNAAYTRSSDAA